MDISVLQGHVPDSVYEQLQDTVDKFEINTPERLSNFLGECHHESEGWTHTQENLNYGATALWSDDSQHPALFQKHFTSAQDAANYARQPIKIANRIYANRMGNGDETSGDGYRFRGKGYIQLTGKTNQQAFFNAIGVDVDSDPNLISTQYPLLSAAWFWSQLGLNEKADNGVDNKTIDSITKIINGGEVGEADRINDVNMYYKILNV